MKRTVIVVVSLIVVFAAVLTACKPDPSFAPEVAEEMKFEVPAGWPQPAYKFENNALTRDGFELGRKLFFDPRLSRGNTVSCGSCPTLLSLCTTRPRCEPRGGQSSWQQEFPCDLQYELAYEFLLGRRC